MKKTKSSSFFVYDCFGAGFTAALSMFGVLELGVTG
jgi:hypothetical protein